MVHFCSDNSSSACLRNILTVENAEGLLKGLDLLLTTCNTVLIALTCIDAGWLQLFIVRKRCIQFLLGSIQICLGLLESLLMVLLLARLVLNVLGLLGLVHRGVTHELIILFLCLCLGGACLGLKAGKIRLNDFDHTNYTTILRAHALVGFIKDLRLLHKGSCLGSFCVKVFQHAEGLGHGCLCILGVLDSDCVLGLLLLTNTGGFCYCSIELSHRLSKVCDFLGELRNAGFELINFSMERLHSLSLFLACLFVGGKLSVTPALVLSLLVGLFHELYNEVLDHLLDFLERIISHTHSQC